MASSMIHLAITQCLTKKIKFKDSGRLSLGSILPDGIISGNSHLKKEICDGTRVTYDLEFFREKFQEEMKQDDLYLGYYLHLIQDIFYRYFIYSEHDWNPTIPGNIDRLHRDYAITNWHVVNCYKLNKEMVQAVEIEKEPITELAEFDVPGLVEEVRGQFVPIEEDNSFFFTKEMADEFIERATAFCMEEMKHLSEGKEGLDSVTWSWEKQVK